MKKILYSMLLALITFTLLNFIYSKIYYANGSRRTKRSGKYFNRTN